MKNEVDPLEVLRAFVVKYKTQGEAAKALGVSAPFLTDLLYGRRGCSNKILKKLKLRRAVVQS